MKIIQEARKRGEVVIGLLTDAAIAGFQRLPYMPYEEPKVVREVVVQEKLDCVLNLLKIKPDYVLHRDDWNIELQRETRQRVIDTLEPWGDLEFVSNKTRKFFHMVPFFSMPD